MAKGIHDNTKKHLAKRIEARRKKTMPPVAEPAPSEDMVVVARNPSEMQVAQRRLGSMMIYDYPPYLCPPPTNEEKEELEKVWQKLREEGRGIEPPTLAAPVFKTGCRPYSGTFQESPEGLKD